MPFLFEIVANMRNGLDVDKYVPSRFFAPSNGDIARRVDSTIS